LIEAGAIAGLMLIVWVSSLVLRDASLVDRFWGLGFVIAALAAFAATGGGDTRRYLVLAMVAIWGTRLSLYLTQRNWGQGEDYRYQAMRRHWGGKFPLVSLFTVFGLQGALMWFIALPIPLAMVSGEPARLTLLDNLGALVWLVGFAFESIGDAQLARFKADPANEGKVMDQGLWRYTRHPNYFGDALLWWGIYLACASTPYGRWAILSPIVMTFLLMRVSGVPLLEKRMKKSRPSYEAYAEKTSAFIPWPPKET
jgi:steroid 5-alpha reductase family enzyme